MYFDLISKAELAQWVESALFPSVLPSWIENLVREEAGTYLTECDFATWDDYARTGYDGTTQSTKQCENVPEGAAKWELGKGKNVRDKAEYEYTRVAEELGADASNESFVFVTPRPFPQTRKDTHKKFNERTRQDWVSARRKEKIFKDVLVIDENLLRKWSAKHFSVGLRIKQKFVPDFSTSGFELPDNAVDRFVSNVGMEAVDGSILLCGRDRLKSLINSPTNVDREVFVCASSEDEALAFACHAFLDVEDDALRAERLRKTLVVTSVEALSQFRGATDKCFIISGRVADHRHLIKDTNQIIVCGALDPESASSWNILRDPGSKMLAEYLESKGVADAQKLAEMAGGSLNCLQRLRSKSAKRPNYTRSGGKDLEHLVVATLLGGWSEEPYYVDDQKFDSKDVEIIQEMIPADSTFIEFKRTIRAHTDNDGSEPARDTLIKRIDLKYWVKAPVDAIDCLLDQMVDDHFEAYANVLIKVFSKQDRRKSEHGFLVADQSGYSEALKTGLALNFCILASRAALRLKTISGKPVKDWVEDVFKQLMKRVDYIQFIQNEGGLLGYFGEAAPEVFIEALEKELRGNPSGMTQFLSPEVRDGGFFEEYAPAGLMWALMRLGWLPKHFRSVVRALLNIHRLDQDRSGKQSPRASTVFGGLYAVGVSQTAVSGLEQLDALKMLVDCDEEAAFDLLQSALPGARSFVSTHSKPIFAPADNPRPTQAELFNLYTGIFRVAISMASGHAERIAILVESFPEMPDEIFAEALGRWTVDSQSFSAEQSLQVWTALRSLVVHHTRFSDADWGMPDTRVEQLEAWMQAIEPSEEDNAKFLFSASWIEMPQEFDGDENGDRADEELTLDKQRTSAVHRFITALGSRPTAQFSVQVKERGYFGVAFAKAVSDLAMLEDALLWLSKSGERDALFYRSCSIAAYYRFHGEWLDSVFRNWESYENSNVLLEMIKALPISGELLSKFGDYGLNESVEEQYWKTVRVDGLARDGVDDRAFDLLLQHGRHAEVLEALGYSLEKQSNNLLIALVAGFYESASGKMQKELSGRTLDAMFKALKLCKERSLFTNRELAVFEFPLAKQFRWTHSGYPFAIHECATLDADYFIELLAMKYKTTKLPAALQQSDLDRKYLGTLAFHVFETMKHPGLQQGAGVSEEELSAWISTVLSKSEEYGLVKSASYQIGEILSQCSKDENDKIWPRGVVRDVLEKFSEDRMLSGFRIKSFNSRGVYSDGYRFFSESAERYERDAEQLDQWPKTQRLLRSMAKSDRASAEQSAIDDQQFDAMPKL